MITVRKIGGQTAHLSEQNGTWLRAPLYTRTLCGLQIRNGEWSEVHDVTHPDGSVTQLVGYLYRPCIRCQRKTRA